MPCPLPTGSIRPPIHYSPLAAYTGEPVGSQVFASLFAMAHAVVGLCTIELYLPGMASLKDKRSVLKSMLARMRNTFNIANAEVDHQDVWQSAVIAVVTVTNSSAHANQTITSILKWIENAFPDVQIVSEDIEIL